MVSNCEKTANSHRQCHRHSGTRRTCTPRGALERTLHALGHVAISLGLAGLVGFNLSQLPGYRHGHPSTTSLSTLSAISHTDPESRSTFVHPPLYRVPEPWPPSYPTLVRHSGPARKMSIVMVGPFPGPFDRSHYSDSCSGNPPDVQPRPPNAQGLGQRPPRPPDPHLALLKEPPRTSGTPRDVVAYSTARTNYGAPSKAYAPMPSRESRHESLPEPPRPRRASLKRKW
ncbi:hypothetical protein MRX96_014500 [Rhipicephalus microplus]